MLKTFFKQLTSRKIIGVKVKTDIPSPRLNIVHLEDISKVIFPLSDNKGTLFVPHIKNNSSVTLGDVLAQHPSKDYIKILASVSGTAKFDDDKITITPTDSKYKFETLEYFPINLNKFSKNQIVESIKKANIQGLGGGLFPSFKKIKDKNIKHVILNAVECEPTNSSDKALLMNYAKEILAGGLILQKTTNAEDITIAIKYNQRKLIKQIKDIQKRNSEFKDIKIAKLPNIYPAGHAKQVIKFVFGVHLDNKTHATDAGFLVQNIQTCFSIYRAVCFDKPQIERVVSITGTKFKNPTNLLIPIGATLKDIFCQLKIKHKELTSIRMGGLMIGEFVNDITNLNRPLLKNTGAVILNLETLKEEGDCLNCGKCVQICPLGLKPNKMLFTIKNKETIHKDLDMLEVCINCNLCSYMCPSNLDVAKAFDDAKKVRVEISKQQDHQKHVSKLISKKTQRLKKEKQETAEIRTERIKRK
ncbi:MAG: RnfABCDGE type electron transport complex subunit C [Proteobacteria bacterium]|nr:RnfABCDGE type electron transport complex subunit C [Pseudomonadota bacterium]